MVGVSQEISSFLRIKPSKERVVLSLPLLHLLNQGFTKGTGFAIQTIHSVGRDPYALLGRLFGDRLTKAHLKITLSDGNLGNLLELMQTIFQLEGGEGSNRV
jgi:hypothetical protein